MSFGYCRLACIPLRRDADLVSEMTSQLLFAESFEILDRHRGHYVWVRLQHDGYEGWLDDRQIIEISEEDHHWLNSESIPTFVADNACPAGVGGRALTLLRGTPLPGYGNGKFVVPGETGWVRGSVSRGRVMKPGSFAETLEAYAHAPYLWGGRSPLGIDCSGFVQMAFRPYGIALPRDSAEQRERGVTVESLSKSQLGDLAFFASGVDGSSHVGIVLSDRQVMHSSAYVRKDRLEEDGIIHAESGRMTHKLLEIKRLAGVPEMTRKST